MWPLNRQKSSSTVNKYFLIFDLVIIEKRMKLRLFFLQSNKYIFLSFCKGSFSSSSFVCSYDFLLMFSKQTSIMSMCREREREKNVVDEKETNRANNHSFTSIISTHWNLPSSKLTINSEYVLNVRWRFPPIMHLKSISIQKTTTENLLHLDRC